jgi:RNA polymerase sigma-70 factor (ECF subfamily)
VWSASSNANARCAGATACAFACSAISASEIAGYSGRGPLRGWLRSVAVHAAWKHLKRARNTAAQQNDDLDTLPSLLRDPELTYLHDAYRAPFKGALAQAMAALTVRQRNLLRQHFVDALSIDQLGALYRVDRSTAARWLAVMFRSAR